MVGKSVGMESHSVAAEIITFLLRQTFTILITVFGQLEAIIRNVKVGLFIFRGDNEKKSQPFQACWRHPRKQRAP